MRLKVLFLPIASVCLLASCGVTYRFSLPEPRQLQETSVSPDTGCHQGYATDGSTHFIFDTTRILTRAEDATWSITRVNETPFAGTTGYNHLGDGDHFEQKLYVPAEHYASCSDERNPAIFVFDATTLERKGIFKLPENEEVSGVVVRPESRELWVSSYCDGTRLWVYNLDSMRLERTVPLSPPVAKIQGLAYHGGFFYLAQNSGIIRRMYLDGFSVPVYETSSAGAHEGLDYSQNELRWLIDEGFGEQKVHYLVPK